MITLFEYKTAAREAADEFVEKRSRFIGYAKPVATEADAVAFVKQIRAKHPDATHNVYAYVVRENNIQRYSDDGEPAGTAGLPVLDVIRKEGLTDICVVATRYFGGTLLGGGGLVRAYTHTAKIAVEAAGILLRRFCFQYNVRIDYALLETVRREAEARGAIAGEATYTDRVELVYYIPYDVENFADVLTEATNGRAVILKKDEGRFVDVI